MINVKSLSIQDFTYQLPPERIAPEPLPDRDQSRLLVYRAGEMKDQHFSTCPTRCPLARYWFLMTLK